MVEHFYFLLEEGDGHKINFDFRPTKSHLHVNDPGKKTLKNNNLYKNYYSWCITYFDKDTTEFETLIDFYCDECSALLTLPHVIKHMIKSKQNYIEEFGCGQPTSVWEIKRQKAYTWNDNNERVRDEANDTLQYTVFDSWNNSGYRFWLNIEESKKFMEWLHMINNYMVQHCEEI